MNNLSTPSAKSSCCGAERTSHLEFIKEKNTEGRTNFYVCSKCGEEWKTSPNEGEMERLISEIERLKDKDEIVAYIQSLQSSLKQAEAERDSYRGDAGKAVEALEYARYLIDFAPNSEEGTKKAYEVIAKILSSLSNHYPSTK